MTQDQIIVFALLGGVLALLLWGRIRYDLIAFSALIVAVILGVVPSADAFSGFGHPATVIIAIVLIVSRGLLNSGAVDLVARMIIDKGRSLSRHIGIVATVAAGLSAVMNNVAALALLMPVELEAAEKSGRSASSTPGSSLGSSYSASIRFASASARSVVSTLPSACHCSMAELSKSSGMKKAR